MTLSGKISDELLDEVVNALVLEAQPKQVILFGSYARGDAKTDSDLDLIVVESRPFPSRIKEIARLERALGRIRVPTDILVYSQEEIEYWRHSPTHVISRALREGKVLYERP